MKTHTHRHHAATNEQMRTYMLLRNIKFAKMNYGNIPSAYKSF